MPVRIRRRALDIPRVADGNQHLRVGDQVFELDLVDLVDDLRAAIVSIRFVHFAQLADDDLLEFLVACQNLAQFGDQFTNGLQLLENFVDGELGQTMQLQFEDGVDLCVAEAERVSTASRFDFRRSLRAVLSAVQLHALDFLRLPVFRDGDVLFAEILEQVFFGVHAAGRTANNANHVVEVVQGNLIAEQNVLALFRFLQLENRAAPDYIDAVLDEELDHRDQAQFARLPGNDGEQDHAERFLHLRVFEKIVQNELAFFAAIQLHADAHPFARRVVAHIGNAFKLLGLHQFGDAVDQPRLVHLIRNFRDDDAFAVFGGLFDGGLGAHGEAAAARFVSGFDAFAARDVRPRREVRARHNLHYFFQRRIRLFDQQNGRVHDLAQIVRRDVRGHADSDAACAIDQQIRDTRGQDDGLFARLIEVRDEVDGFFFQVGENVFRDLRQPRFGIPHGRRRIAVNGTEVPLPVDQGIAHVEVLRETHHRGINHRLAVRMIVAGSVAANFGALAIAAIRSEAEVVHGHEDAALHGLQPVAHIGQRARDNHAHRV